MVFSFCSGKNGKHSPQPAFQDRRPVIQIDFAFMSNNQALLSTYSVIDVRNQLAMAVVAPSKISASISFFDRIEKRFMYETGRAQAILQCGDENLINQQRELQANILEG